MGGETTRSENGGKTTMGKLQGGKRLGGETSSDTTIGEFVHFIQLMGSLIGQCFIYIRSRH